MPRVTFLAAAAALLLVPPAAATAADPLPVGQANGVRVTGAARGVVFHFGPRATALYRSLAGRRADVSCTTLSRSDRLGLSPGGFTLGGSQRIPRKRAPLRTGMEAGNADYCSIARVGEQEPLVAVPLTQFGAIVLDEREKASGLSGLQLFAGMLGDRVTPSAYPSPARLIASRYGRAFVNAGFALVALATPDATPPARTYGYWSDGRRSAAFVTLSATGRRLYLQLGPDDAVSTNVAGALFGDL